jgi:hypothetical protein
MLPRVLCVLSGAIPLRRPPAVLLRTRPCDRPRKQRELLPGVLAPSSRRQPASSTAGPELPRSDLDGPSSAFLTPSTVCSATGLCRLVSSCCHVQGFPSGGSPPPRSRTGFRRPAALCPVGRLRLRFDPRQHKRPRIQGFRLPAMDAVTTDTGESTSRSAPLMGFSSSRLLPQPLQAFARPLRPHRSPR